MRVQTGRYSTQIFGRYNSDHEGLELVWFIDVQHALHNYIAMLGAVGNAEIQTAFQKQISGLVAGLKAYAANPTAEQAMAIGDGVRYLQERTSSARIGSHHQQHFEHPDLSEVSAGVVAAGIDESVNDTSPVRDCILGTSVQGVAQTSGSTSSALAPNADFGVIDALFFGRSDSNNVGYHGPVTIFSTAMTDLAARKRMWIDADGLRADPTAAAAQTRINIYNIQSNKGRRMVERMAWRRAAKQQRRKRSISLPAMLKHDWRIGSTIRRLRPWIGPTSNTWRSTSVPLASENSSLRSFASARPSTVCRSLDSKWAATSWPLPQRPRQRRQTPI